ncbi:LLM class flavin-dependent oxidoreductase [Streptomyces sp. NWU339]|uniref:LLM class flavin-dependent oxidoreductase n=1 Tax=Streptomyces sp. NWU339 TaxID=2185284 RepID=UPI000D6790F4|nr:LLM class flavin-dependent oxidoreductase [Streptomyces sp. NWU339]PWI05650.1 LLM class flavin-dependent oxidoreductase [Streptomyces sp. NWU339]
MKLSLVELGTVTPGTDKTTALRSALDAARQAEELGYHRIWYTEHHGTPGFASHAPELLIALAARETSRIRVGSGAVLLNHYSPFKVAETFLQLEALSPGRIDLGLGRATTGPVIDLALRRDRTARLVDDFDGQVQEILAYLHGAFPEDHPFAQIDLTAGVATRPDVWLLGSSGSSARLAGRLGLGYAFAAFINPARGEQALLGHRHAFTPTAFGSTDHRAMLAVNVVVADTDAEARRLVWPTRALYARLGRMGSSATVPTVAEAERELSKAEKDAPTVIHGGHWPRQLAGSPDTVREQLQLMAAATGAQEIMVQDIIPDPDARAKSRALLADALGVTPAAASGRA